jgi:predicted DNA binding CopG/RHH family protein
MPRKSNPETQTPKSFASEAEAADWYASPEGRRDAEESLARAIRKGKVIVTDETDMSPKTLNRAAKEDAIIVYREGTKVRKTDPKKLQELVERAHAAVLKPVSLRISQGDIEAAKAIGKREGVGYQTVLKDAISEGLRRAK